MIGVRYWQNARELLTGQRKIYYGWWIIFSGVLAMALASGTSFWTFGLYVRPLEEEFGWSRAQVSLGFSCSLLSAGVAGPLLGHLIDSRGPRASIIFGSAFTVLSFLLLASTTSLWQWYAFQAINALGRQMIFVMPFQSLIARWFDRRRAIALGIFGTGFAFGGFVVVPIMETVIAQFGWRGGFLFSAIAIGAFYIPFGLLIVRNYPADLGAFVDGEPPADLRRATAPATGLTPKDAIRTPMFWVIAFGMALLFYGMTGWTVHQVPYYESKGVARDVAAIIVSASAGASIVTRLSLGLIADRVRRFEFVVIGLASLLICGSLTLLINSSTAGIAIFLVFWVLGTSAGPMIEALLVTRAFGVANFATILGAAMVIVMIGQILSPLIAGAIYDGSGSYDWAVAMFLGTYSAAVVLFTIASRMKRPFTTQDYGIANTEAPRLIRGEERIVGDTPTPPAGAAPLHAASPSL